MAEKDSSFNLNGGIPAEKGVDELLKFYFPGKEAEKEPEKHPVLVRQRKIAQNLHDLEDKVKGVLGDSLRADKGKAEGIVKDLAYALAKIDGYSKEMKDFSDEDVRKYLSQAASATGNPAIGNKTDFIKSIINLAVAKPGDPLYDSNSVLAQFIQYIATQQESESKRINYLSTLISEKWTMPELGIKLQGMIREKSGIPLAATATASEALGDINRRASFAAQRDVQENAPKTYLQPPDYKKQPKTV